MKMDVSQLKDKVIIITGASRGIGRATADVLEKCGAKLVLGSRNIEQLEQDSNGENILPIYVDVSNEQSVKQFVDTSMNQFGRIDILINAAGIGTFSSILESDTKDFDDMIAINLRGTYLSCKYVGRHMKKQKEGQIINLVSIAGTTALAGCGGYSASKFGVFGLTKVLQTELRRDGIRITAVLPGSVDSSFWDEIEPKPDRSSMIPVESIAEHIAYLLCQPTQSVVDEITIMPPAGIL
ncbi:SDR family oxidoreductase [Aquibacillus sp. 3ASR75-11]|uniref:SDR family oxidoreductase n=1 Tax=Terrihalobacillus insolitus TaxID=2950438 RepID=A0A9X3WYT4_9BACI|nr:SDR family oxidoreductase [Terrihalobacillus insolitus]MDC3414986.1 SDR family oxidoreductase [Terrihalobacillus insolitus]MDC3425879.1 SDR family oxidoreductase [Terrihalobacillus insolitus]